MNTTSPDGHQQPWLGAWMEQWPPSIEMLKAGEVPAAEPVEAAA